MPLAEAVPLLAALLMVPVPERYPPLTLSPQRQKQKTQEALVAWLLAEAAQHPVLALWEDLHWADPSTLELLGLLIEQAPTARLLLVLTARPEFRPPWPPRSHLTQLTLTRLTRPQVEEMVLRVTGGKPLPAEVVQQIGAKTDGIPLFVEELIKMILELELVRENADRYVLTGPLPPLAIPATLQDALMARLDRLVTAKDVAQLGATLGRQFSYELLQAVAPLDEATLQRALERLVDAELLYQRGVPPQATYTFKHALIQDAAYQSLLKSTRQQVHQQIAQALEVRFPALAETQPELLAHHYSEASCHAQAVRYWQRAGERAIERSANVEAISHLTTALELLQTLPDTPERVQQELDVSIAIGIPLVLTKGYAALEIEATYTRARELCRQLGDTPQLFPVLVGLRRFYFLRGELQTAHNLDKKLLRLAECLDDRGLRLRAHHMLVESWLFLGEFAQARTHAEQGIALYDPQQHRAHVVRYGNDSGVGCRVFSAEALWVLGYPDQALRRIDEALTRAHELAHPYNLAFALHFAAWFYQLRREPHRAQERAEAAIALAQEQGFLQSLAGVSMLRGWAVAEQGQVEEGLAQLRQGIVDMGATGAQIQPRVLMSLADVYGHMEQPEEGLRVLAEADAAAQARGERFMEAELSRLKGELLLAQSAEHQAAAAICFQQALAVARRQKAKSWELRAATSLSRLWQQQGKRAEAHQLLAPVYGWFTEGFDTADLQDAQVLLDELQM
jgi:predicted ATPase